MNSRATEPFNEDSQLEAMSPDQLKLISDLRFLVNLLDTKFSIPGSRIRIGMDSIIGLIPGVGDVAGAGLSGYIILRAYRVGVSKLTLLKMIYNVFVDTVIGAVPLVGDVFDVYWKANTRNLKLVSDDLTNHKRVSRSLKAKS